MKMIALSISTLSCDGFAETNFLKTFDWLPRLNIKNIEFNLWYPSLLSPLYIQNLRARCLEKKLKPSAVHGSNFGGDLVKDMAHKIRLIEIAKELSCSRVVVSGGRKNVDMLDDHIRLLKLLAPYLEESQVSLCLENHADNLFETIEDYNTIFDAIDSPNIGLCLDTGHFEAAGICVNEVIEKLYSRIIHIHLKENQVFGRKSFTRFGEGTTDNTGIVTSLIDLGYQGFLNIELSPEITMQGNSPTPLVYLDLQNAVTLFAHFQSEEV